MVSIEQLKVGLANYLDNELIPTICADEKEAFVVGVACGVLIKRIDRVIHKYAQNQFVKMIDLVDEKGNLDLDVVLEVMDERMKGNGVSFNAPVFGKLTFTKADIASVKKYIEP